MPQDTALVNRLCTENSVAGAVFDINDKIAGQANSNVPTNLSNAAQTVQEVHGSGAGALRRRVHQTRVARDYQIIT